MAKVFLVQVETCYDGDKRFKTFVHASSKGANNHFQKLQKKELKHSLHELKPIEALPNSFYATDDVQDNYLYISIIEVNMRK